MSDHELTREDRNAFKEAGYTASRLVHLVWFQMQPDLSTELTDEFVAELRKLQQIEQVHGLEVGRFQDLEDPRALSQYAWVMRMAFDSEEDYHTYQDHPIHQQLKQDIGQYLGGPPVTYDYWQH